MSFFSTGPGLARTIVLIFAFSTANLYAAVQTEMEADSEDSGYSDRQAVDAFVSEYLAQFFQLPADQQVREVAGRFELLTDTVIYRNGELSAYYSPVQVFLAPLDNGRMKMEINSAPESRISIPLLNVDAMLQQESGRFSGVWNPAHSSFDHYTFRIQQLNASDNAGTLLGVLGNLNIDYSSSVAADDTWQSESDSSISGLTLYFGDFRLELPDSHLRYDGNGEDHSKYLRLLDQIEQLEQSAEHQAPAQQDIEQLIASVIEMLATDMSLSSTTTLNELRLDSALGQQFSIGALTYADKLDSVKSTGVYDFEFRLDNIKTPALPAPTEVHPDAAIIAGGFSIGSTAPLVDLLRLLTSETDSAVPDGEIGRAIENADVKLFLDPANVALRVGSIGLSGSARATASSPFLFAGELTVVLTQFDRIMEVINSEPNSPSMPFLNLLYGYSVPDPGTDTRSIKMAITEHGSISINGQPLLPPAPPQ